MYQLAAQLRLAKLKRWVFFLVVGCGCSLIYSVGAETLSPKQASPVIQYSAKVIQTFPHNANYFTQGLEYKDGLIYESTGLHGESKFIVYNLENQKIVKKIDLAYRFFGEGLTVLDDKIYQLTYRAQTGFIYDKSSLKQIGKFTYKTQGWGLSNDGRHLIMSDGSYKLYFLDPASFVPKKVLSVKYKGQYLKMLNELEYINGFIYANVWMTKVIVQIDPANGEVVGEINLAELAEQNQGNSPDNVLNGIAWDADNERLLITGKRWRFIYHVELIENKAERVIN